LADNPVHLFPRKTTMRHPHLGSSPTPASLPAASASETHRIPYHKLPDLVPDWSAGINPTRAQSKSLLQSMRDYQGFWKPVDLRKRRPRQQAD
jgi:hypothetical protein